MQKSNQNRIEQQDSEAVKTEQALQRRQPRSIFGMYGRHTADQTNSLGCWSLL